MSRGKTTIFVGRTEPEMLTPSEIENLRRIAKERSAYGRIAFKNHMVDLGVKDDADLDARAETPTRDAPSARVDPAAQEQPGSVGMGAEDGDVLPEEGQGRGTAAAGFSRTPKR